MTISQEKPIVSNNKTGMSFLNQTPPATLNSSLAEVAEFFQRTTENLAEDNRYRQDFLSLTASENYLSYPVRMLTATRYGSFYSFIPPYESEAGEWFFPDSHARKKITEIVRESGKALFKSQTFDERPNGGSAAEQAILLATCNRGDGWVHFSPKDGGHFGNEALAQKIGSEEYYIPVNQETGLIDVERLEKLLQDHPNIKLVILDQSHKLRYQPVQQIKQVLLPGVLLAYDCSHDMGLIAGEALPQPLLQGADALIGNTHKTFPSVNKAIVAFADENNPLFKPVSDWVCPYLQSNCHTELILPLLVTILEMRVFGREYAEQTLKNAKILAKALVNEGFDVSGEQFGYTETQQVHIILDSRQDALECVSKLLPSAGFRANNIGIPGKNNAFGLRLGTQAITRRGMKEAHIREVAKLLGRVLLKKENPSKVKAEVKALLKEFPLFPLPYSFDSMVEKDLGQALLAEVLRQ